MKLQKCHPDTEYTFEEQLTWNDTGVISDDENCDDSNRDDGNKRENKCSARFVAKCCPQRTKCIYPSIESMIWDGEQWGGKGVSCKVCNRNFKRLHHLADHKCRPFPSKESMTCEVCDKTFMMEHWLKAHEYECQQDMLASRERFSCSLCWKDNQNSEAKERAWDQNSPKWRKPFL